MKSYPFKKINAFTKGSSHGNPAACIYLNNYNDISNNEMQLIAKELKGFVNEVVYLFQENNSIYLKYYSSECEVDFCGHGTIAIMYDYIKNHNHLLNNDIINIRIKNEYLEVFNKIKEEDSIYITAPYQKQLSMNFKINEIAIALNTNLDVINKNFDLALINAGLNTLIIPINSLDQCLKIFPDQIELKCFCLTNDIDIILVFTNEVANKANKYRTRVFAPKFGYLEDPATGSGNSAFGYYLLNKRLWDGKQLIIEQNNNHDLPNIIKLDTIEKDNKCYVIFGGSAIVKINGDYILA